MSRRAGSEGKRLLVCWFSFGFLGIPELSCVPSFQLGLVTESFEHINVVQTDFKVMKLWIDRELWGGRPG
jgi:hypothetical protein